MRKILPEEYIVKAKIIHNDKYDYSLSKINYKNSHIPVKIICPIHGIFEQSFDIHVNQKHGCPKCKGIKNSEKQRKSKEQFIQESKQIHPEYDYSKVEYVNARTKILLKCFKHGEFLITPDKLLRGEGCYYCGKDNFSKKQRKSEEQFLNEIKSTHGNKYDYSKVRYTISSEKIEIICPIHGSFFQTANEHLLGRGCPRCSCSKGEEKINLFLEKNGFENNKTYFREYKFKELGQKRFDFYIPSKNLLIEYNGQQHYVNMGYLYGKDKLKRQRHSDWIKRKFAKDNGIELLTIPYTEFDNIESILENKIGTLK